MPGVHEGVEGESRFQEIFVAKDMAMSVSLSKWAGPGLIPCPGLNGLDVGWGESPSWPNIIIIIGF